MRQPLTSASSGPHAPRTHGARPRPADRPRPVRTACGHTRYTKGCDICALDGIYADHMNRPGITPDERSAVTRLYLAGDKAALFKLWQAWQREVGSA